MKKYFSLMGLLLVALGVEAQVLDVQDAKAAVNGKTSLASYTGSSEALEGTLNIDSREVDFRIPLESIKTGNGSRDKDMYKALETDQFPYATFKGKISEEFDIAHEQNQKVLVKGMFSLHGVERPLEVTVDLKPTPEGILFYTFWPINITDYGIKRPSVFFIKVEDEHRIVIEGVLIGDDSL